jgi:glucose-6-phosphate isomerase
MTELAYAHDGLTDEAIGDPWGISDETRAARADRLGRARQALLDAHAEGTLGFLNLPDANPSGLTAWAHRKHEGRWTDAVVIGIGGSSLGTQAVLETASDDLLDGLDLHVSSNVDPRSVHQLLDTVPLDTTLFVVVTKSGTTVETMSQFAIIFDRLTRKLGSGRAASQIIAITSPDSGELRALADQHGFESFDIPPNVGGRFSVLTPVGLVPLALAGYPIGALLDGAAGMRDRFLQRDPGDNSVLRAAGDIFALYQRGMRELVLMSYADDLSGLGEWFRQLIGESLAKAENRRGETVHAGITPVAATGAVDQHSQVQLFMEGPDRRLVVFTGLEDYDADVDIPEHGLPEPLEHLAGHSLGDVIEAERAGTRRALQEIGRPTAELTLADLQPPSIGAFILFWESVTAVLGELMDIDAFNQPGVERGKRISHEMLL